MSTDFTQADEQELDRLEQEFEAAGGDAVTEPRFVKDDGTPATGLMDGRFNYMGGNARYDRICELRTLRGDATREIRVKVELTVRVRGEGMSQAELGAIVEQAAVVERAVVHSLNGTTRLGDESLGYAPDGNRSAYIEELVSVDYAEVQS